MVSCGLFRVDQSKIEASGLTLKVAHGAGGQAQGLAGAVDPLRRAVLQRLAAADAVAGRQRQPLSLPK